MANTLEHILSQLKVDVEKALQSLKEEIAKVRTGRASVSMLDDVRVDYYGTMTPLNQVATLNVPEPRLITIAPWESKLLSEIERAIQKAGLGVNPVNDGKLIRLPLPALNEERRKDLVKIVKKHAEDSRVGIRMHRRDANEAIKKLQKESLITEDDLHRGQDLAQKQTDEAIKKVDEFVVHKEKDILSV